MNTTPLEFWFHQKLQWALQGATGGIQWVAENQGFAVTLTAFAVCVILVATITTYRKPRTF